MKGFEDINKSERENNKMTKLSKEQIINQAIQFHLGGNISVATKYYQQIINQGYKDYRVFSNYGVILGGLGKLKEAEKSFRKAIELKTNFSEAHYNLGIILKDLGKLHEGELSYRKAIEIKPDYADAYLNLGIILEDLDKLQEAELSYRKVIEIKPNYAKAHYNLGNLLKVLDKLQEGELSYRKAIEIKPDYADAHLNLGYTLKDLGKLQEAEVSTRKAIEIKPDYAYAHFNLGLILKDLGKLQEAELSYRKVIEIKPEYAEAYLNLSLIELRQGNYQSGFENYEFRLIVNKPCIIKGEPKIKRRDNKMFEKGEKLLIVSEQGLGDTLQFMRYIPYLRNQGLKISFCAQEKLHSLIQSSGIDQNPLTPEEAREVSEGKWIPLLSLPRYLEISPEQPIISESYIFSTNQLKKKWKKILSKEKRPIIGINWQGNPKAEKEGLNGRSLPLETFATLSRIKNFKFLSLQKGFGSEQLDNCSFQNHFVECQSEINNTWDFLENAAIIENCDLIITSDTSIAHLAGGLSKETWLLLQHVPDWRWGLEKENTLWYPSMRLFRQKDRNNWKEVMERVLIAITKEMKK